MRKTYFRILLLSVLPLHLNTIHVYTDCGSLSISPTPCMRVLYNDEVSISGRFMFSSLHVVLTHAKPASVHVEGINIKRALHRYKTISIGSMSTADQFYSDHGPYAN